MKEISIKFEREKHSKTERKSKDRNSFYCRGSKLMNVMLEMTITVLMII